MPTKLPDKTGLFVQVPDDLHMFLRIAAIKQRTTLAELVIAALREYQYKEENDNGN